MTTTTVHVSAADLELNGSYEPAGGVLYLSAAGDDKQGPAQEAPEGHAVRLDAREVVRFVVELRWRSSRVDGQTVTGWRVS